MKRQVFRWVKACLGCRKRKTPRPMRAGITEAQLSTYANEVAAMDILGPFPRSIAGNMYILTMIDTFTRWPVAVPIPNKSALSIAKAMYKFWICEKGVPLKVISDRAREFVSAGLKQLAAYMGTPLVTTGGYNPAGNSSVERFHRYLNASLCIIYEKVHADWDDYVPAVLFSYRASKNDTTGYSPFFLEHGRNPQLPLGNLFPYLQKKVEPQNFVKEITENLDRAFGKARELQKAAAARNKARKPQQFKPNFKPGDFLLLLARSAREGRLEARDDEGKEIPIPEKIRNKYTGPFKMLRWVGERHCGIEIRGQEQVHNVNRLVKHYVWDDIHERTDITSTRIPLTHVPTPEKGEMILFLTTYNKENKCHFGVGEILEVKSRENFEFQWYGSPPLPEAHKPFFPGWVDPIDNKGYYAKKRIIFSHPPWTNSDTATELGVDSILIRGADVLGKDSRVNIKHREKIERAVGERIKWI